MLAHPKARLVKASTNLPNKALADVGRNLKHRELDTLTPGANQSGSEILHTRAGKWELEVS